MPAMTSTPLTESPVIRMRSLHSRETAGEAPIFIRCIDTAPGSTIAISSGTGVPNR